MKKEYIIIQKLQTAGTIFLFNHVIMNNNVCNKISENSSVSLRFKRNNVNGGKKIMRQSHVHQEANILGQIFVLCIK